MDRIQSMDLRSLDLNLLHVFEALLDSRSVTLAGKRLNLSQPAMSYALNRLRTTFHDPLFVRIKNEMHPTPRAAALAVPARAILHQVKTDLLQYVDFDPAQTDRTFTFCMSDIGEMHFLPPLIRVLMERAPRANVRTFSMPPDKLEAALESGAVDVAIGYYPDLRAAGIYQQQLTKSGFACLARRGNPYIGERLTLAKFLKAPHVSWIRELVKNLFQHPPERVASS
jgi:DNA-binding transcriptional LysR family regulator